MQPVERPHPGLETTIGLLTAGATLLATGAGVWSSLPTVGTALMGVGALIMAVAVSLLVHGWWRRRSIPTIGEPAPRRGFGKRLVWVVAGMLVVGSAVGLGLSQVVAPGWAPWSSPRLPLIAQDPEPTVASTASPTLSQVPAATSAPQAPMPTPTATSTPAPRPTNSGDSDVGGAFSLKGSGTVATDPIPLERGVAVLRISHAGNSVVAVYDSEGNLVESTYHEQPGEVSEVAPIRQAGAYYVELSTQRDWTLSVEQ